MIPDEVSYFKRPTGFLNRVLKRTVNGNDSRSKGNSELLFFSQVLRHQRPNDPLGSSHVIILVPRTRDAAEGVRWALKNSRWIWVGQRPWPF